ncbi:Hypothetical_protein [Hexamita inflata]|uniref:Hypothetical_protein n=1 Tax=Hexamita inflata TaxID=28002 RepID=A0AA86Q9F8_9EUKA|nr:Hypothetical protein HINF_LOCUS38948 [Hexamita inflata]
MYDPSNQIMGSNVNTVQDNPLLQESDRLLNYFQFQVSESFSINSVLLFLVFNQISNVQSKLIWVLVSFSVLQLGLSCCYQVLFCFYVKRAHGGAIDYAQCIITAALVLIICLLVVLTQ